MVDRWSALKRRCAGTGEIIRLVAQVAKKVT